MKIAPLLRTFFPVLTTARPRFGVAAVAGLAAFTSACQDPMFLVDDSKQLPHVVISWPTRDGDQVKLVCDRPYRSPNEREFLDRNLECFVALGGTRLDRGIGHPRGAILRVGFYKKDTTKPMFDDIADGAMIDVTLSKVFFTDAPAPRLQTALQHVKFMAADLVSCGLGGEAVDQFNTVSLTDTLYGKITPSNGRMGGLDGEAGHGKIDFTVEPDGSVTLHAKLPYGQLRHVKDPWKRSAPGTFTEPQHFHVEVEVLPKKVADDEESGRIPKWELPPPTPEMLERMNRPVPTTKPE